MSSSQEDPFDAMIQRMTKSVIGTQEETKYSRDTDTDKYVQGLLSKFDTDSRQPEEARLIEAKQSEETSQKYVRDLMRSCFQVEDEAALIKHKYNPQSSGVKFGGAGSFDLVKSTPGFSASLKQAPLKTINPSNLSKQERHVLSLATQNEDQAEDALLALQLLQQYKKDPNFIQKELKDQAKKREQVLGLTETKTSRPTPKSELFNPVLTQEERHRAINEKREQRKKDQRLRQLEESKERRIAKEPKAKPIIPKINRDILPILDHSGTTPDKTESYPDADRDIQRIRDAKRQIEEDALQSQNEVKKIKEDLRQYKRELQEQEKARRDFELQQDLKRKMESEREKMLTEVENARKQMNEYRLSKFAIILNGVIFQSNRRHKGQSFNTFSSLCHHLRFKENKLEKMNRFAVKGQFLRLWISLWQKFQAERELAEFEREQQIMAAKEQTSDSHRRRVLKRKAIRSIKRFVKMAQQERQIEIEHESRKNAIDEFFVNLKERAKDEEEKLKREKLEKLQKDQIKDKLKEVSKAHRVVTDERIQTPLINAQDLYSGSLGESSVPYFITPSQVSQTGDEISGDTINFGQYDLEEEEKDYDIVPVRQFDSIFQNYPQSISTLEQQTPDKSPSQPPSSVKTRQLPERPKQVHEMEMRAQTRKSKREELNKVYQEKQKKLDEERRQAEVRKEEERKKKIQDEKDLKKKAKMEEIRKKDIEKAELELEKQRISEARDYYKRGLMIKYGIIPLSKNVDRQRENLAKAEEQYIKWVQKHSLHWLAIASNESKLEKQRNHEKQMYIALRFYQKNLIRNSIQGFIQNVIQERGQTMKLRVVYLKNIIKTAIQRWSAALPLLRQERQSIQLKEDILVNRFRMMRVGRTILKQLREYTRESRIEREKALYKQKMWSKVNGWLVDLDKKQGADNIPIQVSEPSIDHDDFNFTQYKLSDHSGQKETLSPSHDIHPLKTTISHEKYQHHKQSAFGTIESGISDISQGRMQRISSHMKGIAIFDEMISIEKSIENSSMLSNK